MNALPIRRRTLGALLADSPHTRPVPVSGTASDPAMSAHLGLERSRYEGPTGIVGVLQDHCTRAGLPAVSFWAAVPHYVDAPPCPKATLALLRRIESIVLDRFLPEVRALGGELELWDFDGRIVRVKAKGRLAEDETLRSEQLAKLEALLKAEVDPTIGVGLG